MPCAKARRGAATPLAHAHTLRASAMSSCPHAPCHSAALCARMRQSAGLSEPCLANHARRLSVWLGSALAVGSARRLSGALRAAMFSLCSRHSAWRRIAFKCHAKAATIPLRFLTLTYRRVLRRLSGLCMAFKAMLKLSIKPSLLIFILSGFIICHLANIGSKRWAPAGSARNLSGSA